MKFNKHEIPVAYSMIALIKSVILVQLQPFQDFICYWTAFNNIYITIADQKGDRVKQRIKKGIPVTRNVGGVTIPEVTVVTETKQIQMALEEFDDKLKHDLIIHRSTRYFVDRIPRWRSNPIEYDPSGQRLNGVINVGKTIDEKYPIWSPIDKKLYEHYLQNTSDANARHSLCEQIVNILYTVRNNTVHGGKRADDANDQDVIRRAFPLIKMIVEYFFLEKV
jgi:hypothetical protein